MLNVSLMHHTPLHVAAYAGHTCTDTEVTASCHSPDVQDFLSKLVRAGHESVLEHIVCTFSVEGLSRACLQELVRHRHVSLSVKSTRWALKNSYAERLDGLADVLQGACDCLPERVKGEVEVTRKLKAGRGLGMALYNLLDAVEDAIEADLPNDYVKYYLPECFTTDLVITLNVRELRHIMKLRSQPNVLPEFRSLVRAFFRALPEGHRFLFEDCTENGKSHA